MAYVFSDKLKLSTPDDNTNDWRYDWLRNYAIIDIVEKQNKSINYVVSGLEPSEGVSGRVETEAGVCVVGGKQFNIDYKSTIATMSTTYREQYNIFFVDSSGVLKDYPHNSLPTDGNFCVITVADTDLNSVVRVSDLRVFNNNLPIVENDFVNGTFDVWQRDNSQTSSNYGSVDRVENVNVGSSKTTSKGFFTKGQIDVPNNPRYFLKTDFTTDNGSGSFVAAIFKLRDVDNYGGKRVAVSFYAKANSNKNITIEGSQNFGLGGSTSVDEISVQKITLTNLWKKYTIFVDFPSMSSKTLGTNSSTRVIFWLEAGSAFNSRTDSLGNQSGVIDIAEMEIYPSERELPTRRKCYFETLQECFRYFWRLTHEIAILSSAYTSDAFEGKTIFFPSKMIDIPTVTIIGTPYTTANTKDYQIDRISSESFDHRVLSVAAGTVFAKVVGDGTDYITAEAEL